MFGSHTCTTKTDLAPVCDNTNLNSASRLRLYTNLGSYDITEPATFEHLNIQMLDFKC